MKSATMGSLLSSTVAATAALAALALPAMAATYGQPVDGQLGMQLPASPVAESIQVFHDNVTVIITLVTIFVLGLMLYVMVRFNEKANPEPSRFTHNTLVEVVWTVVPIIILVIIAVPSFKLLNQQYSYPKPDLTIKATGYQWYWSYEYPDLDGHSFDAVMLTDEERAELKAETGLDYPRNLATDNEVVVPVNKVVHVLVTAQDVLHNWTVPGFGSKTDAVPGRLTSTWFQATREGVFYGQCSELCGKDHAFMPITVRVVKQATYDAWTAAVKAKDKSGAKKILQQAAREQAGIKTVATNQ
ncbi:MAG: cytochrome c oxidase subunit II [Hyphomicrobiaceae bacterium]|nr:cytochrome c oxidase subunit II [Hyphomicrobiaceae bacterium]